MTARLSLFLAVILSGGVTTGDDAKAVTAFTGKVSKLGIAADQLGSEWTGPRGLAIDDFNDLSNQPEDVKPVAEELKKQVSSIGVVQTADFTYSKKFNPLHQVTLRIFVFDTEESCRKWWKQKYEFDGWEKHYSAVEKSPYLAADSKETTKRAVALGNVWITCGALQKTEDHLKVLDLYIKKIQPKQP